MADNNVNEICRHMKTSPSLNILNLTGNKFTDEGIIHIARAICETNLEEVVFANNRLTDKCLEPTAHILKTNKNLRTLDLSCNAGINSRVAKNKMTNTLTWV